MKSGDVFLRDKVNLGEELRGLSKELMLMSSCCLQGVVAFPAEDPVYHSELDL